MCLLCAGQPAAGRRQIDRAREWRHGQGSAFEDSYKGLYFFCQGNVTNAIPLLESAGTDAAYAWPVTKLFAVVQLDRGSRTKPAS